jgi:hypothetical protein
MSDELEPVFSGARRTISREKGQLGAENIEKVELLGNAVISQRSTYLEMINLQGSI